MHAIETVAHFVYPRRSNDHKAKVLHSSSLFLLALFLAVFHFLLSYSPKVGVKILGYAANISPARVVELTNEKRAEAGLSSLEYSSVLEAAAKEKGEHMLEYNYWSHVAPDGTEPWIFFTDAGYRYRYAGENLARDFSNPQSAIDAWMASPSHKENLLSAKYSEIGIAVVEGDLNGTDTTIIVQLFGTQIAGASSDIQIAEAKSTETTSAAVLTTPAPTLFEEEQIITQTEPVMEEASNLKVTFSPFDTTRTVSLFAIVSLAGVMLVDTFVVSKKKISRIGGRAFAHLAFLGMIAALVLIARVGEIL